MLGKKLYIGNFVDADYQSVAQWCNQNNAAISDVHAFDANQPYYEVISAEDFFKQTGFNTGGEC